MPDTVKSILETWLRERGYAGLCCWECGCGVDELMPCGEPNPDCEPAMRRPGPHAEYYPAALKEAHKKDGR